MSERQWRSAANRPSRQARRGWASLYEAPSQKKNHLPRATKIQQPKNSPLAPTSSPAPPPPKNPSPCSPPSQTLADSGFFGPNTGQFGSEPGYLGLIPGFPGPESHQFWPPFPLSGSPLCPGKLCKNFTSQPAHLNAPSFSRFPKITQNIGCLSQIAPNLPLSVYR